MFHNVVQCFGWTARNPTFLGNNFRCCHIISHLIELNENKFRSYALVIINNAMHFKLLDLYRIYRWIWVELSVIYFKRSPWPFFWNKKVSIITIFFDKGHSYWSRKTNRETEREKGLWESENCVSAREGDKKRDLVTNKELSKGLLQSLQMPLEHHRRSYKQLSDYFILFWNIVPDHFSETKEWVESPLSSTKTLILIYREQER